MQKASLSHSKAVIIAINGFHAQQTEKDQQAAFLERIIQTIEQSIKSTAPVNAVSGLLQFLGQQQAVLETTSVKNQDAENDDAALDFLDSL